MSDLTSDKYALSPEPPFVETLTVRLVQAPDVFGLESGEYLPELTVAYETYGKLNPSRSNAIMICHGFTASAHAAGRHHAQSFAPGWWDALIGPGKAFDTNRYFVICANVLGGCRGTTGPSSVDPRTGRPYGSTFPHITVGDMISTKRRLLEYLGVTRLLSVAGASMGGMEALEWALRFPDTTQSAIPIGCAARWSAQAVALSAAARRAIEADADFRGGDYYGHALPVRGLAAARMIGHITYVSAEFLELQCIPTPDVLHQGAIADDGWDASEGSATTTDVMPYFETECKRFVGRFDANSYIALSLAMERFNVSHLINASTPLVWLHISFSSDWLFPPRQLAAVHSALQRRGHCSHHVTIDTSEGHDSFLTEPLKYATHIADFLATIPMAD